MNLPKLNNEKMAQTVSPDTSGSSFVPSSDEHERVNYAEASSTGDAHAIHNQRRCIYCGQVAPLVWVHGHGQCACCGINVDECCRGESCDFE